MNSVLYITYIDFGSFNSGSMVRPQKMYDAFIEAGFSVQLLQASQKPSDKRRLAVLETERWLDSHTPDFCYIESSTYPILNNCDIRLIRRLHKLKIPTGYFMRDAYFTLGWDLIFERVVGIKEYLMRTAKSSVLRLLFIRDEIVFRKCIDIMYFPTMTMAEHFRFAIKKALPPAGDDYIGSGPVRSNTCIYVGGMTESYGSTLLLNTFIKLNEQGTYPLIVVCRESEFKALNINQAEMPWLEVHHLSGKNELAPLYRRASLGLLTKRKSEYNNFALSVKLFEYMSYGLPIVAVDNYEMSKFINHYNIGFVSDNSVDSLAQAIQCTLSSDEKYMSYAQNVKEALLKENLWIHRVKSVQADLMDAGEMKG